MPVKTPNTAMVFAAGFGTRMRPLTNNTPKPLIKVGSKTLLDHTLDKLADAGVQTAIVNTHYLADQITTHLANRNTPKIIISHETPTILETGGGIVGALPLLGNEPIFVINTDTLWLDKTQNFLLELAANWQPDKLDALLLLAPVKNAIGYDGNGDFNLNTDGTLQRSLDNTPCQFVYSGAMIIKPTIFKNCLKQPFSIFKDFLFKQPQYNTESGTMKKLHGLAYNGQWLHIGTPDAIKPAEDYINQHFPHLCGKC